MVTSSGWCFPVTVYWPVRTRNLVRESSPGRLKSLDR